MVFSTNKTDCHDITEILLKVALNTINQPIDQQSDRETFCQSAAFLEDEGTYVIGRVVMSVYEDYYLKNYTMTSQTLRIDLKHIHVAN